MKKEYNTAYFRHLKYGYINIMVHSMQCQGEETSDVVVNYKHQGLFGKHTHCILCTIIFMYPYLRKYCRIVLQIVRFSPGTPVSSINKTDRHNITKLLFET
jgi:hypothetical protein